MSRATGTRPPSAAGGGSEATGRPHLKLVRSSPRRGGPRTGTGEQPVAPSAAPSHTAVGADHVLVAGADARVRASMLAELRSLLPADTRFVEAGETWEVIARTPGSRMVVLAGDLGDVSASSLLHMLARRHPTLPVLAVGADRRLPAPPRGPVPGARERFDAFDAALA